MALPSIKSLLNKKKQKSEIRDSSGNLVGYDTGKQSVVATPQEKLSDIAKRGRSSGGGNNERNLNTQKNIIQPTPEKIQNTTEPTIPQTINPQTNITPQQRAYIYQQNQRQNTIKVGLGGSVYYGTSRYYGNAIVGDTGLTANQIRQQSFKEAQSKYGKGNVKMGGYTATYSQGTTQEVTQTTTSNEKLSAFRQALNDYNNQQWAKQNLYSSELIRYKDLGFNEYQSKILAQSSADKGGFSYSREGARIYIGEVEKVKPIRTIGAYLFGSAGKDPQQETKLNEILNKPYKELIQTAPQYAVIKGAREGGTAFFKLISDSLADITKSNRLSPELQAQGGRAVGDAGLFMFFSPAMNTGSYGDAFELLNPKKKKNQQLNIESRFSNLGGELEAETKAREVLSRIELDVANKKNTLEQLRYLKEIRNSLGNDPTTIKNFQDFSKSLIEKQIIKLPQSYISTSKITYNTLKETNSFVTSASNIDINSLLNSIPTMNNVGSLIGVTNVIRNTNLESNTKTNNVSNVKFENVDLKQNNSLIPSTSLRLTSLSNLTKINQGSKNYQGLNQLNKQLSINKQSDVQINKSVQINKQASLLSELQAQQYKTQQIQKQIGLQMQNRYKIPTQKPKILIPIKINKFQGLNNYYGKFPVSVRRKGKFRIVGYGRSPLEAIGIGNKIVRNTLARTFKVGGFKGSKVKGYRTKISKEEGIVFIQPSKYSLGTRGERKEIQFYREIEPKRRKKKW